MAKPAVENTARRRRDESSMVSLGYVLHSLAEMVAPITWCPHELPHVANKGVRSAGNKQVILNN